MKLASDTFKVPEKIEFEKFIVRKLCASDVYLDYMAVMSSIDIIQKTRGGNWPTPELSFEDDLMRNFGASERMTRIMERFGLESEPL